MSIASLVLTASIAAAAPKPDCRVLSISGGGSFGAFEAGVLSGMIEQQPGVDFDYMLGVSAGALNAGYLSTFPVGPAGLKEGVANLKSLWSTTKSEDVWSIRLDPFKAPPSLLSVDPLQLLLEQILQGRSVQRKVTIGTTNLATGATARHDEAELSKSTSLLLRASSAIPLIFPPVEVNGTRHVDGGNSANVLTVHGIDRCDLAAKARGDALPNILIDVILAQQTIEQVDPAETTGWSLLDLAKREFMIAKKQLFDHQLRFRCPPGQSSRIRMNLHTPNSVIEAGSLAILNFDKGADIWAMGYNHSKVNITTFDFCL